MHISERITIWFSIIVFVFWSLLFFFAYNSIEINNFLFGKLIFVGIFFWLLTLSFGIYSGIKYKVPIEKKISKISFVGFILFLLFVFLFVFMLPLFASLNNFLQIFNTSYPPPITKIVFIISMFFLLGGEIIAICKEKTRPFGPGLLLAISLLFIFIVLMKNNG